MISCRGLVRGQVILSMDMAGYSVDMRRTIARISGMQVGPSF